MTVNVVGGRIDHAHHAANAYKALYETVALSQAVAVANQMTDEKDTLIVVTGDHSHAFAIQGYPTINNPIIGISVRPFVFLYLPDTRTNSIQTHVILIAYHYIMSNSDPVTIGICVE